MSGAGSSSPPPKLPLPAYSWLLALIFLLVIVTMAVGNHGLRYVEARLVASTGETLALAASDIADKLDLLLAERYGDIQIMAQASAFQSGDRAAMTRHLTTFMETYPVYVWMGVTDTRGRIIAATDPSNVGQDRSDRDWFRAVRDRGGIHVREAQVSEDSDGVMAVSFTAPITSLGGAFLGAVTTRVGLPVLEDAFARTANALQAQYGTGTRIEYQFLQRDGTVIADSLLREEGTINLKQLGLPSAGLYDNAPPGYVEERHLRWHVPVVTGYAQTEQHGNKYGLDWGILIRIDREDILAPTNKVLRNLTLMGGLVVAPMLGLLLWTTKRLWKEWLVVVVQHRTLQSLVEAEREMSAQRDPDGLLQRVVEAARQLTGARYAALGVFDETGERLKQLFTAGMDEATKRAIGELPVGRGLLGYLAKEEGALRLEDLTRHQASVGFPPHHPPMTSFLGTSIRVRGRLFGRLYLTNKHGRWHQQYVAFTEIDEQAVSALAIQAGMAIENNCAISAIRAAEANYRLLLESTGEGIWGLDMEGRCTFINRAAAEMLGYRPEEVLGRNMHALVHHTCADGAPYPVEECRIFRTFRTGEGYHVEDEMLWRRDKTSFPAEYTSYPIVEEGTIKGAVVAFTDITERRRTEQELHESHEMLRQSQKMEAVGRLAGGIAHDFNNLLTVINGYSQLLLSRLGSDAPDRVEIEEINIAGGRAAALTRQLLAFSRQQVLQPKALDLNAVVANLEGMLSRLIGEDVTLRTALSPKLGRVLADPGQIEQVIMNLAVNARDAMPRGGTLTIETANVELNETYARRLLTITPGPHVMLAVSDTGCGMDKETQARIFEPFFTTKEQGKGTGLGLATVYGIVKQSDGSIWIYSEPGRGTTFKVYLPQVEGKDEAVTPAKAREGLEGGSETILVVEDDAAVRKLAVAVLRAHGYSVLEAADGDEAIRISDGHQGAIHLLVSDVVMPGMDGGALAERVATARPEVKTLFLSGYTDDAIGHHGVLDTGVAFLQKPFTPEALARKVREVLDANP